MIMSRLAAAACRALCAGSAQQPTRCDSAFALTAKWLNGYLGLAGGPGHVKSSDNDKVHEADVLDDSIAKVISKRLANLNSISNAQVWNLARLDCAPTHRIDQSRTLLGYYMHLPW